VDAPGIEKCIGWIECRLEFEREVRDHILVVGRVANVECRGEFFSQGEFDVFRAKPVMQIGGRRFAVAERVIQPTVQ
jgi:flavin reductase (DIM6/NTAB) family NADH-FMN oxidoreductase RutF